MIAGQHHSYNSIDVEQDRYVWDFDIQNFGDKAVRLVEPATCRSGTSDKVEVIDQDFSIQRMGRRWDETVVRLRADGSCDLVLLVPADNNSLYVQNFLFLYLSPCLQFESSCPHHNLSSFISRWELDEAKSG